MRPWIPVTLVLAALVTLPLWAPDRFAERMLSREYLAQGTSVMRRDYIVAGVKMFREQWLLGHGYGQFGDYFLARSDSQYVDHMRQEIERGAGPPESIRPHNMYVDVAVDYGILGLAAYLWLLALLLKLVQYQPQALGLLVPPHRLLPLFGGRALRGDAG